MIQYTKQLPLLILVLLFCSSLHTFSQSSCAFDQINNEYLAKNPEHRIQLDSKIAKEYLQSNQYKNDDCTEIDSYPVVFHWLYDSNNLSQGYRNDNYIINTVLAEVNNYYSQSASASANLPPAFNGVPTDGTCIEFCLARYDHPQNASFHGNDLNRDGVKDANSDGIIDEGQFAINRYNLSASQVTNIQNAFTAGTQRTVIDNIAPAWDATEYINIYVVPLLSPRDANGEYVAGYTFLPNSGASISNSIFMDFNIVSNSFHLSHEIGHWLGLSHVWGDADGCSDNDYWVFPGTSYPVPDTYEQFTQSTTGCNATTNAGLPSSCGSFDNVFNMMDYTNCSSLHFTNDQATYMRAVDDLLSVRLNFNNNLDLIKCNPNINGCTDLNACNYDPNATTDDGSCNDKDCLGNCSGNNTGPAVAGTSCNDGNPQTTNDVYDANCNCSGNTVSGCTDINACNYNPNATVDNGSCNPKDCLGNCNGSNTGPAIAGTSCNDGNPQTTNDVYDANCNCSGNAIQGCTDIDACNYNPNATVDNGSCNPKDCLGNCNGSNTGLAVAGTSCDDGNPQTTNDVYDANCNCSGNTVSGCTDINACNYNPNATVDNGSCNPKDCLGNCNGSNTGPAIAGTSCNDGNPQTTNDVYDANCNCSGNAIQGCTDIDACNYNPNATVDNGSCNPKDCLGNCNGSNTGLAVAGTSCDDGNPQTTNDVYDINCNCTGNTVPGCTDINACNYNPNATINNGSCNPKDCLGNCNGNNTGPAVIGTSCDDGNPQTINDTFDIICNCNGNAVAGCTDINACNFNPNATFDNGSCNPKDCLGNCNGTQSGPIVVGAACDDGLANTVNDEYDSDCRCRGTNTDSNCFNVIEMPYAGWHLVSSFCLATNDSIEAIFAPVVNDIVQVKNINGNVYVPSFNNFNNGLDFWEVNQGYMVKTAAPVTLNIVGGTEVDLSNDAIPLNSGWNLIAYWLQGNAFPIDAFAPIASNVIQVKSLNGAYIPSFNNFDSIDTLRANNGYFVKMITSDNLTFDESDVFSRPAPSEPTQKVTPKHFTDKLNPHPNNATLLISKENNPMNFEDELGIFTESGILVAAFVYQKEDMGGLVYGDDLTEEGLDGLADGEKYVFKIWNSSNDDETFVDMEFIEGNERFAKDDLCIVSFKDNFLTSPNFISGKYEMEISPNPVTEKINCRFELLASCEMQFDIYGIDGKLMKSIPNKIYDGGGNNLVIPVEDLSNGVYLLRATNARASECVRFTIAR